MINDEPDSHTSPDDNTACFWHRAVNLALQVRERIQGIRLRSLIATCRFSLVGHAMLVAAAPGVSELANAQADDEDAREKALYFIMQSVEVCQNNLVTTEPYRSFSKRRFREGNREYTRSVHRSLITAGEVQVLVIFDLLWGRK